MFWSWFTAYFGFGSRNVLALSHGMRFDEFMNSSPHAAKFRQKLRSCRLNRDDREIDYLITHELTF